MITTADEILETYLRLPLSEKKRVVSVILKDSVAVDVLPPTEEELVLAAEDLFLELDRREDEE